MFRKMQNRKGFTLIEMLVVIAIIAILTSVIIPVVSGSTDKAAAATNAANLRSVEGELTAMMLIDPYAFGNQADDLAGIEQERTEREEYGAELDRLKAESDKAAADLAAYKSTEDYQKLMQAKADAETKEPELAALKAQVDGFDHSSCTYFLGAHVYGSSACRTLSAQYAAKVLEVEGVQAIIGAYDGIVTGLENAAKTASDRYQAALNGNNEALGKLDQDQYNLFNFTAVDGIITLPDGVTKINAPASKAVDKDGVTIDKDVQMVVTVDTISYTAVAKYGQYTAGNFAVAAGDDVSE